MILPRCKTHQASAGWRCTVCRQLLCPDCVALSKVATSTELEVCLLCKGIVEPLTRHRAEQQSYAARLPGALVWPLSRTGLWSIAAIATFRAVLSYSGAGWLLGLFVFAGVCFALIRTSARGPTELEQVEMGDVVDDVLVPGFKAMLAAAIVWVPALWWIWQHHLPAELTPAALQTMVWGIFKDPVIWLVLLAGIAYAPMAVLVAASGGSVLEMLWPPHVVVNARRLGGSYALAVGVLCGLFLPALLLAALGSLFNMLPIPFLPRVMDYAVSSYVPLVGVRVLGLLLYTHGDRVGYGVAHDYEVRLLPGAVPRGALPEPPPQDGPVRPKHAPIELEPEGLPPLVEAEVAPARPRVTELDPSVLPPLKSDPDARG